MPSFAIQPITGETNTIWPWLDCYESDTTSESHRRTENEIERERETDTAQTITFDGFCVSVKCVCNRVKIVCIPLELVPT